MAAPSPWRWRMQNSPHQNPSLIRSSSFNLSSISTHRQRSSFIFLHNRHPPSYCNAGPNNARRKVAKKFQIRETSVTEEVSANENEQSPNLNYESLLPRRKIISASTKIRGILLLNFITLLYVLKEVEAVVDPSAFAAVRFTVSAIPFLPFAWRARGDVQTLSSGIELGLWASLGYLMQAFGLLTSDAGRASFIAMFTVVVVPLIDGMLGAVIPASTWFGALMSIIGVGMMECSGSPPCVSIIYLRNFVGGYWYMKLMLNLSGVIDGSMGYHPSSWRWEMFLNQIVKFPWIPALYTGVFSTGLCLWIEMTSMRDVSATETAIVYGLEPVWGAGFAWFFLGERWGVSGWFGAALILGGSLMVQIIGASSVKRDGSCKKEDWVNEKDVSDLIIKK
ncbi:hypothetical protein L1987_61830 [Smallanthus sonchifolius]|uniref:Uncharacterized protein n=1 Tax=Smallanthus sonchifolius TaxID=185202 RepID=A0ACB9C8R0_9ASTR|nr:hypothetical protein L1987_61830 [Smallanthus sonchifolius]